MNEHVSFAVHVDNGVDKLTDISEAKCPFERVKGKTFKNESDKEDDRKVLEEYVGSVIDQLRVIAELQKRDTSKH